MRRAENAGIVFIDEIDKIATSRDRHGADVSREGVQRDLLPIVEGSTVTTKYGPVKTDHVLFIAAGAFHMAKPSDLIPEMQGRFPIRVELTPLAADDFVRILTEPKNALTRQYAALLATEGIDDRVDRRRDSRDREDRGRCEPAYARHRRAPAPYRPERLLDDLLYNAPDIGKQTIPITPEYVSERLRCARRGRRSHALHPLSGGKPGRVLTQADLLALADKVLLKNYSRSRSCSSAVAAARSGTRTARATST